MNKEIILSVLRHLLTAGGSVVTTTGVATSGEWETGVGAFLTIVGLAWAIIDKRKEKR